VTSLVRRSAAELSEISADATEEELTLRELEVPKAVRKDPRKVAVTVEETADGATVTVISGDRVGLLADAAAMLALQKVSVRAARAWTMGEYGVSVWHVDRSGLDAAVLRERLEAIADGRVDPATRLRPSNAAPLAPTVVVRAEASARATVLEVRAADRPGVVHLVCSELARLGLTVTSAHVDTLGPQAVDVFYVQEAHAGALSDTRAADASHAVRAVLSGSGEVREHLV
jgi:[protein-PII] uridylyltransferase